MKSFKLLSAIASLSACSFAQSTNTQVDTVYADVTSIDNHVQELIAATQDYNGSYIGLVPIGIDFVPVHLATRKGYYDSLPLPSQLSESDASLLIDHVNKTLSIDNPRAVNTLKSKKPLLQPKGLDPFIKSGLQLLLSDHLSFSNEVGKRVPQDLQPEAQQVVNVITVALQDGIAYFSD